MVKNLYSPVLLSPSEDCQAIFSLAVLIATPIFSCEYVTDIMRDAPAAASAGIEPDGTIKGAFAFVWLHETDRSDGHEQ
jgi:hypothetical protein